MVTGKMAKPTCIGEAAEMKPSEYHADRTHVSRSMLFELYQSPRVYEARYITRTMPQKSVTEAMQLGTAIHAEVLLGESVVRTCPQELLSSDGAMRTKAAKEWRANAVASGYAVLDKEATAKIGPTVESIRRVLAVMGNPHQMHLGACEQPVLWEEAGVKCKALPDILCGSMLIDIKCVDAIGERIIASKIWEFGYWLQAAHYMAGTGATRFIFLFAEAQAPWRCVARELDEDYLLWAADARQRLLADLVRRREQNDWADEGENEVRRITRPRWAE